jgi:hypothetical protein
VTAFAPCILGVGNAAARGDQTAGVHADVRAV